MRIEPPIELRRRRSNPLAKVFSYTGFLIISAMLGFCIFMLVPVTQPVFKLTRAEGVERFDPVQKIWQPVATGALIKTGERIRTYKIGWADIVTEGASLKLIGGSELEFSQLYFWDRRPRLHLLRGYFYTASQDPGIAVAIGQIAPEVFRSPLFAALSLYTLQGHYAAGFDPSIGHARIYVAKNPVQLRSWFPWQKLILQEKQTAEIFIHPFSQEVTQLSEGEIARLEDGIKRITPAAAAPPAVKIKTPEPGAPQTPQTVPAAAAGLTNAWDLNSFSLYKTKSSQASWEKGEFHYDVPSPESIAGVTFTRPEIDVSKFRMLKIQIHPLTGQGYPETLRIEIKSGERTLRVFTSKQNPAGGEIQFPIRFNAPTPLTDISLLVTHAKAGAAKKGGFRVSSLSFS